jgi:hypothetical protein
MHAPRKEISIMVTTTMVTHNYTFGNVLENSKKVAWREDDVLNGRRFDLSKRFLPNSLSGVDEINCLNEEEKLRLNQIMGNAYCHIFAFVEEFIVPTVAEEALHDPYGDEVRQRSLVRFSEEELKHQELFRRSIRLFREQSGVTPQLIPGREEVAAVVRSKSKLAVLLLIDIIEWFTQVHYTEHVLDKTDLDGLFRDLLRYHWLDEAQHAKIDTMLIAEMVEDMTMAEREAAIDEVLQLGGAIDGLLQQQIALKSQPAASSRRPSARKLRRRRCVRGVGPSWCRGWSIQMFSGWWMRSRTRALRRYAASLKLYLPNPQSGESWESIRKSQERETNRKAERQMG